MCFLEYREFVKANRLVKYHVSFERLPEIKEKHKWVGAQYYNGVVYGIPNDMHAVLKYKEDGSVEFIGDMSSDVFKWTGGCIWKNNLYGFSRTKNSLFKMSLENEKLQEIELQQGFHREHHYGGVCTEDGKVYQPPRNSNHILAWDLKEETAKKIPLISADDDNRYRYCGSIYHPNGYIYFLPERGHKVIKMDVKTEKLTFIGEDIDGMVFDAKVALDGNIYGYSAYCNGIIRIDTSNDNVEMIHKEIRPGAFGTKLGLNGHLYSIPGDGNEVLDFDPLTDTIESIFHIDENLKAKYAGGATTTNGVIVGVPAEGNKIICLRPDINNIDIPISIYRNYFRDCY